MYIPASISNFRVLITEEPKREYPQAPIVGVGAVVIHEGKVLLIKRGKEPYKGLWTIPGGVQRVGESIAEAALRELREEAGIDGEAVGILWVDELIHRCKEGIKYHYVIIDVLVKPKTVGARPGSDASDVRWFNLSTDWDLLETTDSMRRLLKVLSNGDYCILPYNQDL